MNSNNVYCKYHFKVLNKSPPKQNVPNCYMSHYSKVLKKYDYFVKIQFILTIMYKTGIFDVVDVFFLS